MPEKEQIKRGIADFSENKVTPFLLGILVIFAVGFVLHQLQSIFKPLLIAVFLSFIIFWGFIWGPVGMVLAVPISATIQIVCANIDSLKPIGVFMGGE